MANMLNRLLDLDELTKSSFDSRKIKASETAVIQQITKSQTDKKNI